MKRYDVKPLVFLIIVLAAVACGLLDLRALKPLSADADAECFSSGRALEHIKTIAAQPHSVGMKAHAAVHDYIWQELLDLGLNPQAHDAISARNQTVASVQNIWVRVKGETEEKAVLCMSHYDSDEASPGASDDGVGVAAMLESLRALGHHPVLKNDLIFLFTDAEELGLLGARAVKESGLFQDDIGLVLNFDCRGSHGPVLLSQTSPENGRLIEEYARFAPHPVTASWAVEVTRRLPNSTDLRHFMYDYPAMDFAFIDGHHTYHQPTDNMHHVSQASLQQMGETVLKSALHFGNLDISNLRAEDRTYYNFWGRLLHFSMDLNMPVLLVLALCFIALVILTVRKEKMPFYQIFIALAGHLISLALAAATAWAAYKLLLMFRFDYFTALANPYNRLWALAFYTVFVLTVGTGIYRLMCKWLKQSAIELGADFLWLFAAAAAAFLAPGFYFMMAVPLAFSLAAFAVRRLLRPEKCLGDWWDVLLLAAASLWMLLVFTQASYLVALSLGLAAGVAPVLLSMLMFTQLMPLLERLCLKRCWPVLGALALVTILCGIISVATARFDAGHPRPYTLSHLQHENGEGVIFTRNRVPRSWYDEFLPDTLSQYPALGLFNVYAKSLTCNDTKAPRWVTDSDVVTDSVRTLRGRIFGDHEMVFFTPDSMTIYSLSMAGHAFEGDMASAYLVHSGPRPDGVPVELTVRAGDVLGFALTGRNYGLPAEVVNSLPQVPSSLMPTRTFSYEVKLLRF